MTVNGNLIKITLAGLLVIGPILGCNLTDNRVVGLLNQATPNTPDPENPNPGLPLPSDKAITIGSLQILNYSILGFDTSISYSGDSEASASVTVYYCNETLSSSCDPLLGDFAMMTRGASSYTASISNFTAGYTDSDTIKIQIMATDTDGVTGSPILSTAQSSTVPEAIVASNLLVTNYSSTGFDANFSFTGDSEHNASAILYYCNLTDDGACDPLTTDSTAMVLNGTQFTASLTGLSSPYDVGDSVKIEVVVTDPNGVTGSPLYATELLADLRVSNLVLSSVKKNSIDISVSFTELDTDGGVNVVYCNNSEVPSCDPLVTSDGSFALTRNGAVFEGILTGFPGTYDEGEEINFALSPVDPDGAYAGSNSTGTERLADSKYSMFIVSVVALDYFFVTMPRQSSGGGNDTVEMFICDQTLAPGCDPLLSPTPTNLSYQYLNRVTATVDITSIPKGNTINLAVQIVDPDGVYAAGIAGSPVVLTSSIIRPNPSDNYRSVGPGQTARLATGGVGDTLSITGTSATLIGAGAPNLVGQGDALFYDSDGNTTIDSLAFIHARGSNFDYSIKAADGSTPNATTTVQDWFIYRAYTSLVEAENGIENAAITADPLIAAGLLDFDSWTDGKDISTVTGTDENWNLVLYAGIQPDLGSLSIGGWTRGRGNAIRIYTAHTLSEVGTSQRHSGQWDVSKYVLQGADSNALNLKNDALITVRGLQIELTGSSDSKVAVKLENSMESTIERNIIKNVSTGLSLRGITEYYFNSDSGTSKDRGNRVRTTTKNNIIYGFNTTDSFGFKQLYGERTGPLFYNNVLFDNETGVHGGSYRSLDAINNISINNSLVDFSSTNEYSGIKSNIDSDGSANSQSADSKSGNLTEATASLIFTDTSTFDFTLTAGSPAIDSGFDLSAAVAFDVIGTSRTGSFDRGAHNN